MAKKLNAIPLIVMSVTVGVLGIGNVVAGYFSKQITNVLCGTGESFEGDEITDALSQSDALCEKIQADSIVLLKNDNNALPLADSTRNINLFGYGATDKGFLLKGVGSGSSTISNKKKVTLIDALENEGFIINKDIINVYSNVNGRSANPSGSDVYKLAEPSISSFTSLWDSALAHSNTAIFVLSRDGGENVGEIPKTQSNNSNKTYLNISDDEEKMLETLREKFEKVIVLLNTTNTMHAGFLEDYDIDACLYVGITGQSGARAIAKTLNGTYLPSGKLTDTMVYSPKYDPTYVNNTVTSNSIAYEEDIYYGYKWYETADEEGYFDNVSTDYGDGYDGVVQYPFGYGLTYTEFDWEIIPDGLSLPRGSKITADSKFDIKVRVTNTGEEKGKDVVQLYHTPNYIEGEVEKAHVNLVDFAKTIELEPGQSQVVELSCTAYDLAAYDCYDKNNNGEATFEIDEGEFSLKLMHDSHTLDDHQDSEIKYEVEEDIIFDKDPTTGHEIKNRFTGKDAYAGVPIDGSTASINVNYMTRSNFNDSFPTTRASTPNSTVVNSAARLLNDTPYQDAAMPDFGLDRGLRLFTKEDGSSATLTELEGKGGVTLVPNEELFLDLADYDSETWDKLLSQMTKEEVRKLVQYGGFHTAAVESIGKKWNFDYDGPAGFNTNTQTGNYNPEVATESWTAYPAEALMGCSWNEKLMLELGLSMGQEGNLTKLSGWYAPGVNLHRSHYTARNFEYYSEDGVLSGKLAANVIKGAKINGLYCYIKHFTVSEAGPNPKDVNTWLTEQNLRENYLKPFEIAVKEGESNAIMTAFNRVGAVWAGANYAMNVEILRGEWGFVGSVITDWTDGNAGIGSMNVRQGVRGGNDLWLNPYFTSSQQLTTTNAIDMHCAILACKNIIFTFIDTWHYNQTFDESELDGLTKIEVEFEFKEEVFPWWIPVLAGIDVAAVAGLVFFVLQFINKKRRANVIE